MPLRSNAKLFPGSSSPRNKYRDRQTVTAPDGSKRDIQGYGASKNEATADFIKKAETFIREHPSVQTMTFGQLMTKYLELKKLQGRKRKTLADYRRTYDTHLAHLGDKALTQIAVDDVRDVQHRLVRQGKYRTAERALLLVGASFGYAKRLYQGQVELQNPADYLDHIPAPHKEDPKDAIWSREQIDAFLEVSKADYDNLKSLYYPLYLTALSAGLRRGELLGLRWKHVGEGKRGPYIRVREQYVADAGKLYLDTPKTIAGRREIPVTPQLYAVLMAHREVLRGLEGQLPGYAPNDLVFPSFNGTVISPRNLRRSYDNLIARAELPPIYFHSLRKCAATYITQSLVDAGRYAPKIVAQILGHANIRVAQEIYTKIVDEDLKYAVFDPLAKPNRILTKNDEDKAVISPEKAA